MIEPVKQIIEDEHYGEDSLLVGVLASACVGILDSGCYVTRGKVFASSQTGNLLYLAVSCCILGSIFRMVIFHKS